MFIFIFVFVVVLVAVVCCRGCGPCRDRYPRQRGPRRHSIGVIDVVAVVVVLVRRLDSSSCLLAMLLNVILVLISLP